MRNTPLGEGVLAFSVEHASGVRVLAFHVEHDRPTLNGAVLEPFPLRCDHRAGRPSCRAGCCEAMVKDGLGDRCKEFERAEAEHRAMRGLPLLARLDGRAFRTFTRDLRRPYEHGMSTAMIEMTRYPRRGDGRARRLHAERQAHARLVRAIAVTLRLRDRWPV